MKKLFLFLILLLPLLLFAQRYPTGQGTFRTGGGASFTQTKKVDFNEYRFTISPRFGYFITDSWLTGFTTNFTMIVDTNFSSILRFTPQIKYYYRISPALFILGTVEVGVDRSVTYGYAKSIVDHTSVSAGPGVAYFFSRRIGFEINILFQQYLNPDDTHMSKINATGGFLFNILSNSQRKKEIRRSFDLLESDDE